MRQILTPLLLILFTKTWAQENTFIESWQYFDIDSTYHELTVTPKFLFLYSDSGQVDRYKIKLTPSKLIFDKQVWVLQKADTSCITILTNQKEKIILYKLSSLKAELIDFYDWVNEKHRNGNGLMILWRDASERKRLLIETKKNY